MCVYILYNINMCISSTNPLLLRKTFILSNIIKGVNVLLLSNVRLYYFLGPEKTIRK